MTNDNSMLPSYEVWSWIKGYEGRVEISNRGRIRSWLIRGSHFRKKGIRFSKYGRILKPSINKFGYPVTHIGSKILGDYISVRLHREVAKAFVPNFDKNKVEVNHIDGNKLNNNWWNLEWMTRHENIGHAFINGLIKPALGENQANTKLTNEQVLEIYSSNLTTKELLCIYFVSEHAIRDIKKGRTWWHLTGHKRHIKPSEIGNFKKLNYESSNIM